jgi:transposase
LGSSEHLAADPDNEYAMIDSTIVCVHQHSADAKIHILVDALGKGLHLGKLPTVLPDTKADKLIGDRALDADTRIIEPLAKAGQEHGDSSKGHRRIDCTFDRHLYKAHHLIENFFAELKQFRAIVARYDTTARKFLAAIYLAAGACGAFASTLLPRANSSLARFISSCFQVLIIVGRTPNSDDSSARAFSTDSAAIATRVEVRAVPLPLYTHVSCCLDRLVLSLSHCPKTGAAAGTARSPISPRRAWQAAGQPQGDRPTDRVHYHRSGLEVCYEIDGNPTQRAPRSPRRIQVIKIIHRELVGSGLYHITYQQPP